jgi:hypothetical protein
MIVDMTSPLVNPAVMQDLSITIVCADLSAANHLADDAQEVAAQNLLHILLGVPSPEPTHALRIMGGTRCGRFYSSRGISESIGIPPHLSLPPFDTSR